MTEKKFTEQNIWRKTRKGDIELDVENLPSHVYESLDDIVTDVHPDMDMEDYPTLAPEILIQWLDDIRSSKKIPVFSENSEGEEADIALFWKTLLEKLTRIAADIDILYKKNIERGHVAHAHITRYLKVGDDVYVHGAHFPYGGKISALNLMNTMFGKVVKITVDVIHFCNGGPSAGHAVHDIWAYKDTKNISELPVLKITDSLRDELGRRNETVIRYSAPGSFVRYEGNIYKDRYQGVTPFRADGRIMIDPLHMARLSPDEWRTAAIYSGLSVSRDHSEDSEILRRAIVPEEDKWRVWPALFGFSMRSKRWGRFDGWRISDISWRDDAFEKVVMPEKRKNLIKRLVEHQSVSGDGNFSDIIDGKGGGLIVLLAGTPGTGKTLLAETVAEVLHRPLYMVSVGELGTDPRGLENSLRQILDLAMAWNASVLIDEADIFLEARDNTDVLRNAMTSVFLRMLEYHDGNLFLTTNRADNLDEAFSSRISIRLDFEPAGADKQRMIWNNLLIAAGHAPEILDELRLPDMNGRAIKNCIRQACTLARAAGTEVTQEHIYEILEFQSGTSHKKRKKNRKS